MQNDHFSVRIEPTLDPDFPILELKTFPHMCVMGTLGDDRGWTQPPRPPCAAADPTPTPLPQDTDPIVRTNDEIIANTSRHECSLHPVRL